VAEYAMLCSGFYFAFIALTMLVNVRKSPFPFLHLATSEIWCWFGGRGVLRKLSLCYSIVYNYIGAQWYEQFI